MEIQELQLIEEIKKIEKDLFLKKSQLGALEAQRYGPDKMGLIGSGTDSKGWLRVFSELIEMIGSHSEGGDSVRDISIERSR